MKVKLRNLDDEVLNLLKGKGSSSSSEAAAIQQLTNQINELTNRVQSLTSTHINKDNVYTKDNIKQIGSDLKKDLTETIDKKFQTYAEKKETIAETMLDEDLQYKVNARYNNLYSTSSGGSSSEEVAKLQAKVQEQQRDISTLKASVASALKSGDTIPVSSLPQSLRNALSAGIRTDDKSLSLDDFNVSDRIALNNAITSDSATVNGKLSAITDFLLKQSENGSIIYATNAPDEPNADDDQRKKYGICGTAKILYDNSVAACFSAQEVAEMEALFDEETSLDSSGNTVTTKVPYYNIVADFSSTNKYYEYNRTTSKWEAHDGAFKRFSGQFIGNESKNKLYFITPYEAVDLFGSLEDQVEAATEKIGQAVTKAEAAEKSAKDAAAKADANTQSIKTAKDNISALQKQADENEKAITTINTDNSSVTQQIEQLNTSISETQKSVNNILTSPTGLASEIKNIEDKFSPSYNANPGKIFRADSSAKINGYDLVQILRAAGSDTDIAKLTSTKISMLEIFSEWDRISCYQVDGSNQNGMNEDQVLARGAYRYDSANEAIICGRNSDSYSAFISNEAYGQQYTLKYMMDQRIAPGKGGDNDGLFCIVGYMVDSKGKFHTISIGRMSGTDEHAGYGFVLAYDLYDAFIQNASKYIILGSAKTAAATWNDNYTYVQVKRDGKSFECMTADPNQDTLNESYKISWTLPDAKPEDWSQEDYDNIKYMMEHDSKIGFGTESNICAFKVAEQTGLFDQITVYDLSTSQKKTYKDGKVVKTESMDVSILPGTLIYSVLNDKLFYYRGNGSFIEFIPRDTIENKLIEIQNNVSSLATKVDPGWTWQS